MLRVARRSLLLVSLALCFSVAYPRSVQAQIGNWEYVEELGGWLDWDTGLVWGDHSAVLNTGAWSFNGANNTYLPNYRAATGILHWRLPTRAEVTDAASKDVDLVILPPAAPGSPYHPLAYNCWTSTTRSKSTAYIANFQTGGGGYYSTKSYTNVVPVYRAFVP